MKKRVFSIFLVICLISTQLPMSAFADGVAVKATVEPKLIDFIFTYYADGNWKDVSILNNDDLPQITFTAARGYTFKAKFENPEQVKIVVVKKTADILYYTDSGTSKKVYWGGNVPRWWMEQQPGYTLYTRYPQ